MYAFFDHDGVLHLNQDEATAKRSAAGKVVKTDLGEDHGYPVIGSKSIVYYKGTDKAYVDGNKEDGTETAVPTAIRELVNKLN